MERFFSNPSNAPRRDADTDTGITLLSGPPCWYAPHCSPCPAQTSPFWHALRRDRNGATVDLSTPSDHAVPLFWCKVSGKTSLLFQFAVNRAAESGRGVVFICSKGRLESNPPFLSQGVDPSMSLLQRIQIKYIEDVDDIRKYFAAFHLLDDFPAAVIVDDFADFFSERSCQQRYGTTRGRDLAMVRVLALCHNAIGHANAKLGTLGSCNLLLSDVHQGDTPRSLFIYQRWINSIYTIRGDGKGSYILQNIGSSSSETGSKKAIKAKYSIALQYLVLEETSN